MNERNARRTDFNLWFDVPFIIRVIKKWIFIILCMSICAGILGYVGADVMKGDTYTVTGLVSILPKSNTDGAINDGSMNNALTRNVNMWKSNVLRKRIKEKNPNIDLISSLSAAGNNGAYLINLSVSAASAEEAYRILNTAIHCYSDVSDSFDQEYRNIILTRLGEDSVSVVKNNPYKYAVLGFGGVFCFLMVVLLIWTMITGVIHSEEQAEAVLDVPRFEALPSVKKKGSQKRLLIADQNLPLDYLEGIDKMTSRVEQHMLHHDQKIVMVTSIMENEGKTTIAANLATNLARRGNKTLLVELDFRKPALYRILEEKKNHALNMADVLIKGGSLKKVITTRYDLWNLDVLWQFKRVRDTDSILENSRLEKQLKELAEEYKYIVVDTPPISAFRDADVAAQICDASIIVIRQDFNKAAMENDVIDQLEENGAPCMGAILNNCNVRKRRGRYGYNYHYGEYAAYRNRKGGSR